MLRMNETAVLAIDKLDLSFAPRRWPFADERRSEIDAHFEALRRRTPALWNGRVLLLSECMLGDCSLRGEFFETDYASFLAWRDWDWPDRTVTNCFAMGALQASDGAFLLGVMGQHTANAGRIYFPAGTPEPEDIRGTAVDLDSNVMREVAEETGLTLGDFTAEGGWCAVLPHPRLCLLKRLRATLPATELRAKILEHLARDAEPEFADIRIVRGRGDLDPMMPPFVVAFLHHAWGAGPKN
jgi:8-oxo-dGTP pyrophosphatase MutT (NUDIX family)